MLLTVAKTVELRESTTGCLLVPVRVIDSTYRQDMKRAHDFIGCSLLSWVGWAAGWDIRDAAKVEGEIEKSKKITHALFEPIEKNP